MHRSPRTHIAVSAWAMGLFLAGCAHKPPAPSAAAGPHLTESIESIPVTVQTLAGKSLKADLVVTMFRPTSAGPHPLAVINHGRAVDAEGRAKLGRVRYADAARYFVDAGYVVAVPVRLGYGATGGPDVEQVPDCQQRAYIPGFDLAASQVSQVIRSLQQRSDVRKDQVVVVGQSYGGAATLALGAQTVPGVRALINFAGGGGGNPDTHPGRPCNAPRLEHSFAHYGSRTQLPSLWLYSANDLFWGPSLPQQWAQAYNSAGGQAQFVGLPADGNNGHGLFVRSPQKWQPVVQQFLRSHGLLEQR